ADRAALDEFEQRLSVRVSELTSQIYALAGDEFNLNSPKQIGSILFDKMGLPGGKKTKTGWSTNAEVLEALSGQYEIVAQILEYRTLTKLTSTYCQGLKKAIGPDGRIHTTFRQTETRTGRISSIEPNLQNIPVRTPLGSELRKFFRAGEGMTLVDADYSQIELRVLAHIAGDQTMIDAFRNGTDIHAVTASQVFGIPLDAVTPQMRSNAKAVNFGIVYGISAFSLSKDIGVTNAEAAAYIKSYMTRYAAIAAYMKRTVEEARAKGYAETLYGRRRYLPELTASNFQTRSFGERVARNMPIQGTAADIIKIAMIAVYKRLRSEGMRSRLILQIHDELLLECPVEEAEKASALLKEEMEKAVSLSVPMLADAHSGENWYIAKG
ncbi:MAG: DNA polymerase I, partial [Clostridia bacterium]|nr:DNA polymerase I [Clostridia bacterium]